MHSHLPTHKEMKNITQNTTPTIIEEKIKQILTQPQQANLKTALEKDHAIDCLFLLYLEKGRWKDTQPYMQKNNLTISDGTFRSRMNEFTTLGLAKIVRIDPLKKYYLITPKGKKTAELILKFFDNLNNNQQK